MWEMGSQGTYHGRSRGTACAASPLTSPCSVFQGNDQVRFELSCYSLAPQIKVSSCSSPLRVDAGA